MRLGGGGCYCFIVLLLKSALALQRCKMTGVDQESGEVDKIGPLEILREYRAPRGPGKAEFGQLLVPLTTGGTVSVGDPVKVLDRKKTT